MLYIKRRAGSEDAAIINKRWEVSVIDKQIETVLPRLRLRALKHRQPYVFTISVRDRKKNTTKIHHLYLRWAADADDRSNVIVIENQGHRLEIGVACVRGNHVSLGFSGNPDMFKIVRSECEETYAKQNPSV